MDQQSVFWGKFNHKFTLMWTNMRFCNDRSQACFSENVWSQRLQNHEGVFICRM